jgi:hypothetical protein
MEVRLIVLKYIYLRESKFIKYFLNLSYSLIYLSIIYFYYCLIFIYIYFYKIIKKYIILKIFNIINYIKKII